MSCRACFAQPYSVWVSGCLPSRIHAFGQRRELVMMCRYSQVVERSRYIHRYTAQREATRYPVQRASHTSTRAPLWAVYHNICVDTKKKRAYFATHTPSIFLWRNLCVDDATCLDFLSRECGHAVDNSPETTSDTSPFYLTLPEEQERSTFSKHDACVCSCCSWYPTMGFAARPVPTSGPLLPANPQTARTRAAPKIHTRPRPLRGQSRAAQNPTHRCGR